MVRIGWSEPPDPEAWRRGDLLLAALLAQRRLNVTQPGGPMVVRYGAAEPTGELSAGFLQYLVNQQVQARLARPEEPEVYDNIMAWFKRLEGSLAELLGIPSLELVFSRQDYNIQFREESRPPYSFQHLPSGYASIIRLLAELILRVDARGHERGDPRGVVLIDEIDAFLHPALQERVMPFLVKMFPQVQFVVATHSPAVAVSMTNATVVNVGRGECFDATTLVGTPYGQLMVSLFGIETDVDLETTQRLHVLKDSIDPWPDSGPERDALRQLAVDLGRTNHLLVHETMTRLLLEDLDD